MNLVNNSDNNKNNVKMHATGFCRVHPPGGLVVWPNGMTTRIGYHRINNTGSHLKKAEKKAFVAWPEPEAQQLRA